MKYRARYLRTSQDFGFADIDADSLEEAEAEAQTITPDEVEWNDEWEIDEEPEAGFCSVKKVE